MAIPSSDPSALPPAAIAQLKAQLGLTLSDDDGLLIGTLRSAIVVCEQFIGQVLLRREHREVQQVSTEWQYLSACPVAMIDTVTGLDSGGGQFLLEVDAFAIDIDAMGRGRVRVWRPGSASRIEIGYIAGMADNWSGLPEPIRQGIVLLAAHSFQNRHQPAAGDPPAAIGALWRPWRWMRLA